MEVYCMCRRYEAFLFSGVLQMIGRARQLQCDKHEVAVVMVHEPKKCFNTKFLYEPCPWCQ